MYSRLCFLLFLVWLLLLAGSFAAVRRAAASDDDGTEPTPAPVESPAENQPAAVEQNPAPPELRRAWLYLAPEYGFFLDGETDDSFGHPYGGTLSVRYHVVPMLSLELGVSYLVGYQKQKAEMAYASYTRLNTISLAPFYFGVNWEILPRAVVNPHLGVGGGGTYFVLYQDPQDVDSAVPLSNDELSVDAHRFFALGIAKAGLDIRLSANVGLGVEAVYRYLPVGNYRIEIPSAEQEYDFHLSELAAGVGITVYY